MDRMACVNLPELPLQILLHQHPEWTREPAAVVDQDKPLGLILWTNDYAREAGIQTGMRYAAGLALARDLRAGVVTEEDIDTATHTIADRLTTFSPRIEPSPSDTGIFWVDASGLRHVYSSLHTWAATLTDDLQDAGFHAVVSVGFTRFGSYATARATTCNRVFDSLDEEQAALHSVSMDDIGVSPKLRDSLSKLGIHQLGKFLRLPADGIRRRFGREAHTLHQLSQNTDTNPVPVYAPEQPVRRTHAYEQEETDRLRLLVQLTPMLKTILSELTHRRQALATLRLSLTLDNGHYLDEVLSSANPTLDPKHLMELLRLRIDSLTLTAGVIEMMLEADGIDGETQQLEMFHDTHTRDITTLNQAFAEIRAEFGNTSITRAVIHDAHLPEQRVDWLPLEHYTPARPHLSPRATLVRRLYHTPVELPLHHQSEPLGWLIARASDGPIEEVIGPHITDTAWWHKPDTRHYFYVRTRSGRWLWIYHQPTTQQWFMHGEVE